MLKVGIVGCGCIFTMQATSCDHLENATLVGVCDIKKDRADAAAKRYNVPAYYDYKDLIKPELIDVVHICVPHYLHPIISKYALEQGVLGGLGVDVYAREPFPAEHPYTRLLGHPDLILTPHMAWGAVEARERCIEETAENIRAFLRGEGRNRIV